MPSAAMLRSTIWNELIGWQVQTDLVLVLPLE